MPFWKKRKNDTPKPANDMPDKKSDLPKQGKPTLAARFGRAMKSIKKHVNMREIKKVGGHTLTDLRKPKEIGVLVVAIVVPGGMFGWFAYRVQKYRLQSPANDNKPPSGLAPDSKPPETAQKKQAGGKKRPHPKPPKP